MTKIIAQSKYCGKVWENKRVSLGINFSQEKEAQEEHWESQHYENERARSLQVEQSKSVVGLSSATIPTRTAKSRSRKGLRGISGLGKLMLANAGYRLQKKYTRQRLGFTTFTLPTLPTTLWVTIDSTDWELLETAMRKMMMYYLNQHWVGDLLFCVEIQTKRYAETGYPYPHWHCIHPSVGYAHIAKGTNANPWYIHATKLRKKWKKLVWNWIGNMSKKYNHNFGKDSFETIKTFNAAIDMQAITKDASRYIAKYASKGSDCIDQMVENGHEHLIPYQWWYVSTNLKKEVLDKIIRLKEDCAKNLLGLIVASEGNSIDLFTWYKLLTIQKDDGTTLIVGAVGQLTSKGSRYVNKYNTYTA